MVFLRIIAIAAVLLWLAGCDKLPFGQANIEDKTLYPLQNAIEEYIAHQADAPAGAHAPGHSTGGNGHGPAAADADPAHADPPAAHGEDTEDHPDPGHAGDEEAHPADPTGHDPHAMETSHAGDNGSVPTGHGDDAVDHGDVVGLPVVVVAVVDSHYLLQASEEDEEAAATQINDAQRRERVVRGEIHNALVLNTLIMALPRDAENEALARQFIIDNNSEALSKELCMTVGESLGAEIIICVLIDEEGREVNVAAQVSATGEMIYQDVLKDWEPAVKAIEEEPVE